MKYLFIFALFFQTSFAQDSDFLREPNEAPKEPPYVSEEEWEQENPDTQPVIKNNASSNPITKINAKKKPNFEVIEETDKYYKVRHPWAKKGLRRIKADGTYIFDRTRSKIDSYAGFKMGTQTFTNLVNNTTTASFEDVYSKTASIYIDWEKPAFKFSNNLKWAYGLNLIFADGSGFSTGKTEVPLEKYTLLMLPLHAGFTYHMQYWGETQWMVPYVGAGGDIFLIYERRNDGEDVRTYTFGGHVNAGIRFLLDRWMNDMHDLDDDYGINHVWLTLDFKKIIAGEPDTLDVTSDIATIGFGFDI